MRAVELSNDLRLLISPNPDHFWFVVLYNALQPAHLNHFERLWRLMRSIVTRNRSNLL